ncbi:glycosyl hydrolase family 28-related protein [Chitinophaga flava]|uniref:Rhamnogalacturonase A/B/Epimerase-like pectate lyase domain-containing protein n=1 Tax=Chitinophaga flava TaxID=2259036 RepID=A0A365XUS2_9BACT|nr:glycosyl hydrolase family 28-related protein [Chitinophaga flava]RBL89345.1 hypothetical protein DF182_22760 [Chitinophaga flava]
MTFTSLSAMKNAAVVPQPNDVCTLLGYYELGDAGAGTFYWDSLSAEQPESGLIVPVTGQPTGRWKRLYSGPVNICWFGARAVSSFDNAPAIQAAINYCSRPWFDPSNVEGSMWAWISPIQLTSVYVPKGVFEVHQTIILNPYTKIFGESSPSTITTSNQASVLLAVNFNGYMFDTANMNWQTRQRETGIYINGGDLDSHKYSYVTNIEFDSISFFKQEGANIMGYLKLSGATNSRIRHCMFRHGNFPVVINASWDWVIEDCFIQPEICGIVLYRTITAGVVTRTEVAGQYIKKGAFEPGLPFGFSLPNGTGTGAFFIGQETCGIYQEESNASINNCVIEMGLHNGIASNNAGGAIEHNYIESITRVAYTHINCPHLDYRLGYLAIPDKPLLDLHGFSRGSIYFGGLNQLLLSLGTVDPSSAIKLYNLPDAGLFIPKGIEVAGFYETTVSGDIHAALKPYQIDKKLIAISDISLASDDINLSKTVVIRNGTSGQINFLPTKHIFYRNRPFF